VPPSYFPLPTSIYIYKYTQKAQAGKRNPHRRLSFCFFVFLTLAWARLPFPPFFFGPHFVFLSVNFKSACYQQLALPMSAGVTHCRIVKLVFFFFFKSNRQQQHSTQTNNQKPQTEICRHQISQN
jgi:hypothetical protein